MTRISSLLVLLFAVGCNTGNFGASANKKPSSNPVTGAGKNNNSDGVGGADGSAGNGDGMGGSDGSGGGSQSGNNGAGGSNGSSGPGGSSGSGGNGGDDWSGSGGGGGNGNPNGGTGGWTPNGGPANDPLNNLPGFGMMVNNLECGMCHVKVHGDVISTRAVPPLSHDSMGAVVGDWHVNGAFQARQSGGQVTISGQLDENTQADVPKKFPDLNFALIKTQTTGSISAPVAINKVHAGNLTLIGTSAAPIRIQGDVYVEGDLIVTGYYTGIGTIYASGSIYIPADLRAINSAFPFADDEATAKSQAQSRLSKDGLGLAAQGSVLIADLDVNKTSGRNGQIYPNDKDKVYNWYPKNQYAALYKNAVACNSKESAIRSVNVVDAFLYAKNYIAGVNHFASFSIRGGIIADTLHFLNIVTNIGAFGGDSRKNECASTMNPIHSRESNWSHVEYDWRMGTGKFKILEQLGKKIYEDKKTP